MYLDKHGWDALKTQVLHLHFWVMRLHGAHLLSLKLRPNTVAQGLEVDGICSRPLG